MENNEQPKLSFVERMKLKAFQQKSYGGDISGEENTPKMEARDCPNCAAPRAYTEGLTTCAYCGFEFIATKLSDGIHLKKENN